MSEINLEEIKARCDAATLGPWKAYIEGRDHTSGSDFIMTVGDDIELGGATVADYDFIAQARTDVPMLVNEVLRLRAELARRQ